VLEPASVAAWQKRMTSLSYTRPKEMCGVEALKQLTDWLATGISLASRSVLALTLTLALTLALTLTLTLTLSLTLTLTLTLTMTLTLTLTLALTLSSGQASRSAPTTAASGSCTR